MELAVRTGSDRFVAPGAYRALEACLRKRADDLAEMPAVVVSAFDLSTRLLPFVGYDSRIFPPGANAIAGALHAAGFGRTRAVFQLWNRNFRPSHARIDGRPVQMLLVSSMKAHAQRAYDLIGDACSMGADRPLIIAGGAKAMFEPSDFWSIPAGAQPAAPDVVVTGESYVLLDFLNVVVGLRRRGEPMRTAFERARREGALESVPGLVYLAPEATLHERVLIDTGVQRLVQHLDELPDESAGLALLEPPHRGRGLASAPIPESNVGRHAIIASLLVTQGCKFTCSYCPIPAMNQKSWRFRHPEALVRTIRTIHERFGIQYFFGSDDNFFNRRETAEEIFTAMAKATACGRPFGERIRFSTEATQIDTYRNRDLLPLARRAGLYGIWFGIEDLTASFINKGQKPDLTIDLFRLMREMKISPMAMIMFHAGQPFYSRGSLYGLVNQIEFLRKAGAVSLQCTAHTPMVGTREYERTFKTRRVLRRVGGAAIPESKMVDGTHIVVNEGEAPWKRQLMLLCGYAAFYNPWNFLRALRPDGSPLRRRRIGYQAAGQLATLWTAARIMPYILRLMTRKLEYHTAPPAEHTVPVRGPVSAFSRTPPGSRHERGPFPSQMVAGTLEAASAGSTGNLGNASAGFRIGRGSTASGPA